VVEEVTLMKIMSVEEVVEAIMAAVEANNWEQITGALRTTQWVIVIRRMNN
jgi:hypothetical protein